MECIIREMRKEEFALLDDFLYNAIFIPEGYTKKVPRDIIYNDPLIYASFKDFGTLPDDYCLVAEKDTRVIGAVWVGIREEYGHIDDETPSLSISINEEYRNQSIGTQLMTKMLKMLRQKGYKRASLSINKENYALKMYEKLGFEIIGDGENETEYLMVCEL